MTPRERVAEYLGKVCAEVRCSDVHRDLRLELEGHINEIIEAEIRGGATEDEAVSVALASMGDAGVIGESLNRVHKPRLESSVLGLLGVFVGIAMVAMHSVSGVMGAGADLALVQNTVFGVLVGGVLAVLLYSMDYRRLKSVGPWLLGLAMLLLIYPRVQGLPIWLLTRPLRTLAAITPYPMVLGGAVLFSKFRDKGRVSTAVVLGLVMVPALLLMSVPLISMAGVYLAATLTVLFFTQKDKWQVARAGVGVALVMVLLVASLKPYALARLRVYLNPGSDPYGAGYTQLALLEAVEQGGPFGQRGALDVRIPEPHTDFVLTYLIYRYGWVAGAAIIMLAGVLIYRLARTCGAIREPLGRTIAIGVTVLLAVQFVGSILVSVGKAPTMSIALPFVSYGRLHMAVNIMSVGLVMGIYRVKDMISYSTEATNGKAA